MNRTPALACALLLAVLGVQAALAQVPPAPQPPQPPPPPVPHLRVTSVTVGGVGAEPQPQWVQGTPTNTTVHAVVQNQQTDPAAPPASQYTLLYQWQPDGGSPVWLRPGKDPSDPSASTDVYPSQSGDQNPVGNGATRTHQFPWNLTAGQAGWGHVLATVTSGGESHTGSSGHLFIPNHQVSFQVETGGVNILPGETRFFHAFVNNTGNAPEPVTLALLDPAAVNANQDNTRVDSELKPDRMTVPPGSSRIANLYFRYALDRGFTPFQANFTLRAVATNFSRAFTAATPSILSSQSASGYPPGYTFGVQGFGGGTLFAPAGGSATLPLLVRNTAGAANGTDLSDTYRVTATADHGWNATADASRLGLHPGEQVGLLVRVSPQPGAAAGTLTVTVASDHGQQPPVTVSVPLRSSGPAPTIVAARTVPAVPYVGDDVAASIDLANLGDQPYPGGGQVLVAGLVKGVASLSAQGPVGSLDAGERQTLTFPLGRLATGGAGQLLACWAAPCNLDSSAFATGFSVHAPDFAVTAPSAPLLAGAPGERVGYRVPPHIFTVRNTGNAAETLALGVSSDLGTAQVEGPPSLTIAPNETRFVPTSVLLPIPTGTRQEGHLTLTVQVEGHARTWQATTQTRVNDTRPPRLTVGQVPAQWAVGAPFHLVATATDDSAVQKVTVQVTGPAGSRSVPLAPGPSGWEASTLLGPAGNYTLAFRAWDVANNTAAAAPQHIAVRPIPPPVLRLLDPGGDALPADSVLRISVVDALAVHNVTLRLDGSGPGGTNVSLAVEKGMALFPLARFPGLPPGNRTFVAEAANEAGARGTLTFTVRVAAPPAAPTQAAPSHPAAKTPFPFGAAALAVFLATSWKRRRSQGRA